MEAALVSAIASIFSGRVFPDWAPSDTPRPFAICQQVGGESVNFVDNTTPSKRNARVQINVWADSRLAATSLAKQVEDALILAANMQARPLGALIALHDADIEAYGAQQDFNVWAPR